MRPLIITGTDTDVGKTWASLALMRQQQNYRQVIAMKPIASGCEQTAKGLRNQDALLLQQHSSILCDYHDINPYSFSPPVSPHFAAEQSGQQIDLNIIEQHYQQLQNQADLVIIEGIGGWTVPFNPQQSLQDLALQLNAGVILVVGLRLGCINHAQLTVSAMLNAGVKFVGWIANHIDPNFNASDSFSYLKQKINLPCLGYLPFQTKPLSSAIIEKLAHKIKI